MVCQEVFLTCLQGFIRIKHIVKPVEITRKMVYSK